MIAALLLKLGASLSLGRFAVSAALFTVLERLFPNRARQRIFRPGWMTDLLSYLVNGSLYIGLYHLWRWLLPDGVFAWMQPLPVSLYRQPAFVQAVGGALVGSFVYYWGHRALHKFGFLWRFHAVHHSIKHLDWLASYRGHVFETCYFTMLTAVPLALLAPSPSASAGLIVYRLLEQHIEHSNVRVPLGPFKWVFPSPLFHSWHHALDADAQNKNFSSYPLWDVLFGTAFMPRGRSPVAFGTSEPVPDRYVGQVAYPFGLAPLVERVRERATQMFVPSRFLRAMSSNAPRST